MALVRDIMRLHATKALAYVTHILYTLIVTFVYTCNSDVYYIKIPI